MVPSGSPWARSETHEIPSQHQKALCSQKSDHTPAQVPCSGCGVSISEVFQNSLDMVLGNSLWWPCLSRGIGPQDPQRSRPPSAGPRCYADLSSGSNEISLNCSWIVCIAVQLQYCLQDGCAKSPFLAAGLQFSFLITVLESDLILSHQRLYAHFKYIAWEKNEGLSLF